jgi:ribosomal protein S18 acetylase RimI-like enzyme
MWREVGALAPDASIFQVQQRVDMLLVRSNLPQRIPHMILDPLVDGRDVRDWVTRVAECFAAERGSLMVAIPPGEERGPLVEALQAEGFMPSARPLVAMARAPAARDELADPWCEIAVATSDPELREARTLLARVFGLPTDVFAFYTPPSLVQTYVLRRQGVTVAAMCLCPFAGYAGIYSVAVAPSERGQGHAKCLVRRALHDAMAGGLTTAVLSCDRGLVSMYRTLGFTPCWELAAFWLEAWWR